MPADLFYQFSGKFAFAFDESGNMSVNRVLECQHEPGCSKSTLDPVCFGSMDLAYYSP